MKIAAVILAGGLARRMGGGDKGLMPFQGRRLIDHVMDRVCPQVDKLLLNVNGDPARFGLEGVEVVPDCMAGNPGPLVGILSAMQVLDDYDYILSVPTDTPFLPDDLVSRLKGAFSEQVLDAAITCSAGYEHPVIGLWSKTLQDDLRYALETQRLRKMKLWLSRHRYHTVEWECEPVDPFFNANKPEDLKFSDQ